MSAGAVAFVTASKGFGAPSRGSGRAWVPRPGLIRDLPRLMQIAGVPGMAIAVSAAGRVIWSQGFGVKNSVTRDPVTARTLFEAASMTKPAFAYVVMKLVDENRIALDRPLVEYLRPTYLGNDPALDLITVRDVLRHSTGLPNWATGPLVTQSPPGKSYTYSGEAFVWLQLIAERLTGEGLGALMKRKLLAPAGMTRSTMGWDAQVASDAAYGHAIDDSGRPILPAQPTRLLGDALLPMARRWNKPIERWTYEDQVRAMREAVPQAKPVPHELLVNAAGGLMTTASDYLRLMHLMMERQMPASWKVTEASRRAMLTDQLPISGPELSRGLGWELERHTGFRLFEHSGSNYDIFHSLAVGDAESGNAIAIFTNGANGSALAGRVVREAAGLELFKFLV